MRNFDKSAVAEIEKRLRSIPDDKKPEWGSMSAPQMRAHMQTAIRYSLGKEDLVPLEGSAFIRLIIPLFLNGWLKFPKNTEKPKLYQSSAPSATVEDVMAELKEFLQKVESKTLNPPPHSSLGDLGVSGWCKLHQVHFDHHLRQFGV